MSTNFGKTAKYEISRNSLYGSRAVPWWTDGQADDQTDGQT
jgi:hypothetical protein